jgi:acid phosphatase (class A)
VKEILHRLICAVVLGALCTTAAFAGESSKLHYLKDGDPSAAELLAPPPLQASAEQSADLDEVRAVNHAAGSNDIASAYAERRFSVFDFTAAVGPFFVETNLPKTAAFFEKVQRDAAIVTDLGKDYFHRPRPFMVDTNLANGKLEKSFSYPSGHSTESMVLALVLADLLPDRRDDIIAHARLMGWHRVQIARHFPTDIYAGRVLAQAIVKQMKKNDDFEKNFAAVKKEIEAARKAANN